MEPPATPSSPTSLTRAQARLGCQTIIEALFQDLDGDCALLASLRATAIDTVLNSGFGARADGTYDIADVAGATLAWLRTSDRRAMPAGAIHGPAELKQIIDIYAACAASTRAGPEASEDIAKALLQQAHAAGQGDRSLDVELRRCQSCLTTQVGLTTDVPDPTPRPPCRHLADVLPSSIALATAQGPRILVVFYSRSGATRRVARDIAALMSCEILELVDPVDRQGMLGYLRCLRDVLLGSAAGTPTPSRPPAPFDLVVIGTPVWAGGVSTPVRTYLSRSAAELKAVAFFATCGGLGLRRTFDQMRALVGHDPVATLGFTRDDLAGPTYREALLAFVARLERALPAPIQLPAS